MSTDRIAHLASLSCVKGSQVFREELSGLVHVQTPLHAAAALYELLSASESLTPDKRGFCAISVRFSKRHAIRVAGRGSIKSAVLYDLLDQRTKNLARVQRKAIEQAERERAEQVEIEQAEEHAEEEREAARIVEAQIAAESAQ